MTGNLLNYSDACNSSLVINLAPQPTLTPSSESSFCKGFLANVRMVLASTDSSMDLDKLADMANEVMEVATSTVASLCNPI